MMDGHSFSSQLYPSTRAISIAFHFYPTLQGQDHKEKEKKKTKSWRHPLYLKTNFIKYKHLISPDFLNGAISLS